MMLPEFQADGNLPPGKHSAGWGEVASRFGTTAHRKKLLLGLERALAALRDAGCRRVYLDGSFVTSKRRPNDYDVAWDPAGVNIRQLLANEPTLGEFGYERAKQKLRFHGEFFPSNATADLVGNTFLEYFQIDKKSQKPKGIVVLDL